MSDSGGKASLLTRLAPQIPSWRWRIDAARPACGPPHRQRPGTAKGFVFLSLKDETGIMNAILTPDVYDRYKFATLGESFLLIFGALQNQDGVLPVKATSVEALAGVY